MGENAAHDLNHPSQRSLIGKHTSSFYRVTWGRGMCEGNEKQLVGISGIQQIGASKRIVRCAVRTAAIGKVVDQNRQRSHCNPTFCSFMGLIWVVTWYQTEQSLYSYFS